MSRPGSMGCMPGFRGILVDAQRQRPTVLEVIPGFKLLGHWCGSPIADKVEWGAARGRFGAFLPDPHRGRRLFARFLGSAALIRVKDPFADPQALRRHFDQFVRANIFERELQAHFFWWGED
ncbi:MAG: hypothetical protein JW388_1282 [Nitrospira sp.]|nr:hypothetical protein [Nitrospira sp.]